MVARLKHKEAVSESLARSPRKNLDQVSVELKIGLPDTISFLRNKINATTGFVVRREDLR